MIYKTQTKSYGAALSIYLKFPLVLDVFGSELPVNKNPTAINF